MSLAFAWITDLTQIAQISEIPHFIQCEVVRSRIKAESAYQVLHRERGQCLVFCKICLKVDKHNLEVKLFKFIFIFIFIFTFTFYTLQGGKLCLIAISNKALSSVKSQRHLGSERFVVNHLILVT